MALDCQLAVKGPVWVIAHDCTSVDDSAVDARLRGSMDLVDGHGDNLEL